MSERRNAMRTLAALLAAVLLVPSVIVPAFAQDRATPIFVFHTEDFWLNLHHFLYVLGRHENQSPDRNRTATAGAPADAAQGLPTLTPNEQRVWQDAVTFYAQGPSRKDVLFDDQLVDQGVALAKAAALPALDPAGIDPATLTVLQKAAPLYRKAWWHAHLAANQKLEAALRALVARHGTAVQAFVTRAYQFPWMPDGFPVHLSAWANWAGAFSTRRGLLIVSSLDPTSAGDAGLETIFHEAMHQWPMFDVLQAEAKRQGKSVPNLLEHAMIFYTAGEAVRSVVPGYVPTAQALHLWDPQGLGAFREPLTGPWHAHLNGQGTRDEAIAEMFRLIR
jgi:hypothetical protein